MITGTQFNLRLSQDLLNRIKESAAADGKTVSVFIRETLENEVLRKNGKSRVSILEEKVREHEERIKELENKKPLAD